MSELPKALEGFAMDHIGIATPSLEEGKKFYEGLGFTGLYVEDVPTEKVRVGMYELANTCRIELLEPTSSESPVAKFLDKRGPGIHHICLRVENIRTIVAELKESGFRLINEEPRPGAHGCQVVFVHPASAGGVLVELSEPGA